MEEYHIANLKYCKDKVASQLDQQFYEIGLGVVRIIQPNRNDYQLYI